MPAVMRGSWIRASKSLKTSDPDWAFPTGTSSPARQQSRPDALFVRPIPDRQAHLDPSKMPPQDRDFHLVELKLCPDTNPFITLERAVTQHSHAITRLKTRSSRNPNRNNKVTLLIHRWMSELSQKTKPLIFPWNTLALLPLLHSEKHLLDELRHHRVSQPSTSATQHAYLGLVGFLVIEVDYAVYRLMFEVMVADPSSVLFESFLRVNCHELLGLSAG
eukprot:1161776-Pelagomonas_calceolata.AAC.14